MAADRAAELTEAYRILSDEGRRGEYDRARGAAGPAAKATPQPTPAPDGGPPPSQPEHTAPPPPGFAARTGPQFKAERASRDEFVRKATVSRLRVAVEAIGGGYDEVKTPGFDLGWTPKSRMFDRAKRPRLLCRFVSRVDRDAVSEVWAQAMKTGKPDDEVCLFLMGAELAPAGELATAIGEQRKRQRTAKLALIPVDANNWDAHMPLDAPSIAKALIARLKTG